MVCIPALIYDDPDRARQLGNRNGDRLGVYVQA
jgi:hypothetical protein